LSKYYDSPTVLLKMRCSNRLTGDDQLSTASLGKETIPHWEDCWNKRGSDMTQLSFDDNKGINIQ
jgi:hypothetical protein